MLIWQLVLKTTEMGKRIGVIFTLLAMHIVAIAQSLPFPADNLQLWLRADSVEHLLLFTARVLSLVATCLASLGLVLEALLRVEFLLTGREHEIVAAFLAL